MQTQSLRLGMLSQPLLYTSILLVYHTLEACYRLLAVLLVVLLAVLLGLQLAMPLALVTSGQKGTRPAILLMTNWGLFEEKGDSLTKVT